MSACICVPCTTPAYGAPGYDHCAACCYGSLITEYDHACPVADHGKMAIVQNAALSVLRRTTANEM